MELIIYELEKFLLRKKNVTRKEIVFSKKKTKQKTKYRVWKEEFERKEAKKYKKFRCKYFRDKRLPMIL